MNESEFPTEFAAGWKDIIQPELDEVIRLHKMFREGRHGGKRATMAFRNLSHRDLSGHDLSDSDFSGCRMQHANLRGTKLTSSNTPFGRVRRSRWVWNGSPATAVC